jgi:hypothetical protein
MLAWSGFPSSHGIHRMEEQIRKSITFLNIGSAISIAPDTFPCNNRFNKGR